MANGHACVYSGFGGYTVQLDPEINHGLVWLFDYTLVGSEGTQFDQGERQHMGHNAVYRSEGFIMYTER